MSEKIEKTREQLKYFLYYLVDIIEISDIKKERSAV